MYQILPRAEYILIQVAVIFRYHLSHGSIRLENLHNLLEAYSRMSSDFLDFQLGQRLLNRYILIRTTNGIKYTRLKVDDYATSVFYYNILDTS